MPTITRVKYILPVILVYMGAVPLSAQELLLKQYTVNEGLPSNEVYQVAEDSSGRLLIATDRDVVYYDGYDFQPLQSGRKLKGQPVFGIYQAPSGKTYLYGSGKIFIRERDSLSLYPYNHLIIPRLASGQPVASEPISIYSLAEKEDSLWIIFPNYGRELITGGNNYYPTDKEGIYFDLERKMFYKRHGSSAGKWTYIYITWEDGRQSLDSTLFREIRTIKKLLYVKAGDLDIFCFYDQLFLYRNKKKAGQYQLAHPALSMELYDHDKLLIGYQHGGAGLYELTDTGLGHVQFYAVPGVSVYDIFRDFQGGIWFSTLDRGLFYGHPNLFRSWHDQDEITAVSSQDDLALVCYRSGTIRVFRQGGLHRLIRVPLRSGEALLHCYYLSDRHYFAVTNLGVYHIKGEVRLFRSLAPFIFNPLPSALSKRIFPEDDSTFYIGYNNTLYRFSVKNGYTGDSLYMPYRISAFVRDDAGRYWLGSFNRLYRVEGGRSQVITDRDSLLQTRIVALEEMRDGWLAIATLGSGLLLYHTSSGRMYVLNEKNGLPTTVLHHMQVVQDTVWLGTNRGLVSVTLEDGRFSVQTYDKAHGFPDVDIKVFCIAGDWLYFKCDNRLYTVSLSRLKEVRTQPPPVITSVRVNDRLLSGSSSGRFRYDEDDINIHFQRVNFERGAYQQYRYRLHSNGSHKWYTTTDRQALFTNLQPGDYVFEVQVADAAGRYRGGTATYTFTILPPFWNTILFYVLAGIVTLCSVLLLTLRRVNAIRQRNRLLLSLAEHQQKALVQQMSPHFIYNVVNTAQGAIINGHKMEAIDILSRFTRLMRLSLELSREKTVLLEREIQMLEQYLALELIRFPGKFTYSIHIDTAIDPRTVRIPGMLIQPFVENAIKHGISHLSGREGRIDIVFERGKDMLRCTVSDNGVGRERAAQINSNRAAHHRSAGIAITIHRLELLHQAKRLPCTYTVTDRYDESGNAAGTTIVFSMPCD